MKLLFSEFSTGAFCLSFILPKFSFDKKKNNYVLLPFYYFVFNLGFGMCAVFIRGRFMNFLFSVVMTHIFEYV